MIVLKWVESTPLRLSKSLCACWWSLGVLHAVLWVKNVLQVCTCHGCHVFSTGIGSLHDKGSLLCSSGNEWFPLLKQLLHKNDLWLVSETMAQDATVMADHTVRMIWSTGDLGLHYCNAGLRFVAWKRLWVVSVFGQLTFSVLFIIPLLNCVLQDLGIPVCLFLLPREC